MRPDFLILSWVIFDRGKTVSPPSIGDLVQYYQHEINWLEAYFKYIIKVAIRSPQEAPPWLSPQSGPPARLRNSKQLIFGFSSWTKALNLKQVKVNLPPSHNCQYEVRIFVLFHNEGRRFLHQRRRGFQQCRGFVVRFRWFSDRYIVELTKLHNLFWHLVQHHSYHWQPIGSMKRVRFVIGTL